MLKRTLLAAAVTALTAGTALAQSSVTVYGRVNVTAEYQDNIGAADTQKVLQNNASRIGFRGVEDLGGGLKADFLLEHRFNVDTGTQTNPSVYWAGDSFVGLAGGFGYLRAGRMTSEAYYATADFVSLHNHDTGTSEDKLYTYLGQNANTISYRTPRFGGFTAEGSVSASEGTGDANKVWGLAANYEAGAMFLGAGYELQDTDDYQFALRGLYTMGNFTFGGYYQYSDLAALGDRNNFRLSGMYVMGAGEFHVNVGWADDWSKVNDSAAVQWTIAYNYNLSKRTKVYAFYTTVDNGNNFSYFGATGAGGAALDPSSFAVGIRHNF